MFVFHVQRQTTWTMTSSSPPSLLSPTDLEPGVQQHIQHLQELRGSASHQGHVSSPWLPGHRRGDGGAAEGGQEPGEEEKEEMKRKGREEEERKKRIRREGRRKKKERRRWR